MNQAQERSRLSSIKSSLLENYFHLSREESEDIAAQLETVSLDGGQPLFHQGDATDSMYLLVRGRLQVWSADDTPVFIGEVSPGESVGEVGLITGETRSADVFAVRNSILIKLMKADFENLAAEHPAMVMQLASVVAKRLHENTTGIKSKNRPIPSIICIRPLDDTAAIYELTEQLIASLNALGDVLTLSIEEMQKQTQPHWPKNETEPLSEDFQQWFSEQEANYRFIVLVCHPRSSHWSEFAENQSDLILLIAHATSPPIPRNFESSNKATDHHIKHNVLLLQHVSHEISGTADWLMHRSVDYHLHIRGNSQADLERVVRVVSGTANGLVLGGGAARGFAHIGIYRALQEAGITIDWVGGTSIGAIMGVAISLFEDGELVTQKVRDAFVNGKPFGDFTLPLVSILAGQRMNTLTQKFMPGNIEDLAIPFFAISSDIGTGEVNVHESGPIWRATGASAALPGVLPPMIHKNSLAVDGAVLNNLPVDVMASKPVGTIFASMLTSKDDYEMSFEDVPSPWRILFNRLLPSDDDVSVPGLTALLFKATEVANRKRTNELAAAADVLFQPPVQHFNLLSVEHFDQVAEAGYDYAKEILTKP